MQQTDTTTNELPALTTLPLAHLQIVQAGEISRDGWPYRQDVEPKLEQNADGLWLLSVRRQGEHGKFEVPYIGTEVLLADAEMGMVVCLIGYHGTEAYGRKRDKHVTSGQFYRYYQQQASGDWQQVYWRAFNDELRTLILETVEEKAPEWARKPGKLSADRKPPAKQVIMTSYKVVRLIDGRYFSLFQPDQEYVIGERSKQAAKPGHKGGFFSYPTLEEGTDYLSGCVKHIPFHDDIETPALALLEVEIGGRVISYGHKMASTYLKPVRVLEVREIPK